MTFDDCVQFVGETPNGFLATTEGEQPHVRPMTVWHVDRSGLYFFTSAVKPLFAQLLANRNVEIAFHQPGIPSDMGIVLRIAGTIEIVTDMKIREKLYQTYDWLKEIGTGQPDSPTIVVFRISSGHFNVWTWENNVNPGPWIPFP